MTTNGKDLISLIAARGRDLLTIAAIGSLIIGILLVLSDNISVRAKLAEMTGIPTVQEQQQEILRKLNQLSSEYQTYTQEAFGRSRVAEAQRRW